MSRRPEIFETAAATVGTKVDSPVCPRAPKSEARYAWVQVLTPARLFTLRSTRGGSSAGAQTLVREDSCGMQASTIVHERRKAGPKRPAAARPPSTAPQEHGATPRTPREGYRRPYPDSASGRADLVAARNASE